MSEQVGSVTRKKSSDFHGGIRFQSSFTIRWELEDKNFLKIDIICLEDSLKYRIMIQKAWRDGLANRFWIDTRLLSVRVKCPDPGVASHDQKPNRGIVSGIKSLPLARTPPPPPTGFTLIDALDQQ